MKKYYKKSPFKHLKSFGSIFVSLFSDIEVVKGFKENGGLKGILMAFQGKTASEIKQQEIYDKIKLEETARAKIRKDLENEK